MTKGAIFWCDAGIERAAAIRIHGCSAQMPEVEWPRVPVYDHARKPRQSSPSAGVPTARRQILPAGSRPPAPMARLFEPRARRGAPVSRGELAAWPSVFEERQRRGPRPGHRRGASARDEPPRHHARHHSRRSHRELRLPERRRRRRSTGWRAKASCSSRPWRRRRSRCRRTRSIFTSRFPPEHGVRDNGGFFLSPDQLTLATLLKRAGFPDRRRGRRIRPRRKVGAQPGLRDLRGRLRPVQAVRLRNRRRPAAGQRGRGPRASLAREGEGAAVLRRGCTSTTRTPRTSRPSRSRRATPSTRTAARLRSSTRRSPASSTSSNGTACSTRTIHRRDGRPRRGSQPARRGQRTVSSSTRARRACRSSSGRPSRRCADGALPTRCAPWT